jgi:hypothetical protein
MEYCETLRENRGIGSQNNSKSVQVPVETGPDFFDPMGNLE